MLDESEMFAFDAYFASVAAMQFHPGSGTKEHKTLTLEECRDQALQMIAIRRSLIGQES